jgi:ATP-dependent protease ClpP protease subunit
MEIKYSKIVARDVKEAVVEIYGNIGEKVNGDYLASEINYLGKSADLITFRINSLGGSVIQGLSIIGAIVASPAKTVAIVEGVAGSMAGVIALSCKKVKMNDFARIMLHAPYMQDEKGNAATNLSKEDKASIKHMTGMLTDLLSRRGKSQDDISKILKTDSWYNAQDALKEGFVDEIIDTGVAANAAELSVEKLVAFASEEGRVQEGNKDFLNSNIDMKKIAAKLGLPEASAEDAIIAAIDQKETALANERKSLVDSVIAVGRKNGTITDANVASMTKLGATDLNLLVDLVVKPVEQGDNTRLSHVIAKVDATLAKIEKGETKEEKSWNDFSREELNEMKASDLPRFKALYKAYWGQEWK